MSIDAHQKNGARRGRQPPQYASHGKFALAFAGPNSPSILAPAQQQQPAPPNGKRLNALAQNIKPKMATAIQELSRAQQTPSSTRTVLEVTRYLRPWTVASVMLLRSPQGLADPFGCSRAEIVTFPDGTYLQSGAWYPSPPPLGFYR